ncbi:SYS1 [Cordylochernes scorpioides]|uniref:SYS1 n=1 Tax=Cordylochernes scorpioides TaxID=51811 RepID=A0ABY6KR86_9ARAC|nr:SYS1 [Cordylochernes scorpioides]
MDIKNVWKWCREFNEVRINVHDEQRSGRPSLLESTVARIDKMVRANWRITLEEIEDGLNEDCSHFSVHKIVSETLGYRKVSASALAMWKLVKRTKLCLDFAATVYLMHTLICWYYNGAFPHTASWWLLYVVCLAVACVSAEFLCMRSEMRAIPLSLSPKADL